MFNYAKPIFLKDKEKEMNVFAAFKTVVGSLKGAKLSIAA